MIIIWIKFLVILVVLTIIIYFAEKWIKKKYQIPKKRQYQNRMTTGQKYVELIIIILFFIGAILSSITENERSLLPIPLYLWMGLFFSVLFFYRGHMVKKHGKDTKEYYLDYFYAAITPVAIIIAVQMMKL
ncbi:surface polysaccharide O-acyltransferase-like enzyme [Cytobacillus horneckiae]|uniref:DUF4181 domain-containing protein n=1 Tax=Cytobacillus horneckiae TaxID=549687 RepID=A0A2N0ZEN9_9BACI|nr:DUF4181 domain-containing protein [Cytobacillus horneckiae]MBN6888071.1 DUF4181 domain-containing protein [Cytobacillus horneckiae]MCM3176927.1 DUF4181 domain-containing protein [Cytobacillus horneckiae]MEC1158396.1 DUF4181 domain-containing protein [Cytobacillus horneckiae]MED2937527.1 DUF4181 domain-containing protein [Cytobacillus horneckiae]PKG27953.1 DUF4181 domain-containing protein [Cytobacillus horneckiae]